MSLGSHTGQIHLGRHKFVGVYTAAVSSTLQLLFFRSLYVAPSTRRATIGLPHIRDVTTSSVHHISPPYAFRTISLVVTLYAPTIKLDLYHGAQILSLNTPPAHHLLARAHRTKCSSLIFLSHLSLPGTSLAIIVHSHRMFLLLSFRD